MHAAVLSPNLCASGQWLGLRELCRLTVGSLVGALLRI